MKVLNNKHVLYVAYETIIYDFSCSISDLSQYYMWPNEVLNIAYESIVCLQPMKVRSIGNLWKYHMLPMKVLYIAYESKIHNL